MTVNLPYLLLAIALLWFPRHWLRLGSFFKRRRSEGMTRATEEPWRTRESGDPRVNFGGEFAKFRNYIDLLRAAAGSLALMGGFGFAPSIGVAEGAARNMTYVVMAPDHPSVSNFITPECEKECLKYIEKTKSESDQDRTNEKKEKTGVFTGSYVVNPYN